MTAPQGTPRPVPAETRNLARERPGVDPPSTPVSGGPADEPTDWTVPNAEPAENVEPTYAPGSGDARVDHAIAKLDGVGQLPGPQQVAEYESVHRVLQDTLATIDET